MSAPGVERDLAAASWPAEQVDAAVAALAARSGGPRVPPGEAARPDLLMDRATLDLRLVTAAARCALDAFEERPAHGDVEALLRHAAPAVVVLPAGEGARLLLVLGARARALRVLGPDGAVHRVERAAVRAALCAEWEGPLRSGLEPLLGRLALPERSRDRVASGLLADQLHAIHVGGVWTLRPSASRAPWALLGARGVPAALLVLAGAYAAQVALGIVAWALLGRGALSAGLPPRLLLAWGALLLAALPLRLAVTWAEGRAAIGAGAMLKERLLLGALRLAPEEVRHQGAGAHLGRVIESEVVELLGTSGGLMALMALVELAGAAWVLAHGAAAGALLVAFAAWIVVLALAARPLRAARERWTRSRLAATRTLVECMSGHETRLAQQSPGRWHEGEDEALAAYHADARVFDRWEALWSVLPGRGWMVLGLGVLAILASAGATPTALAVAVGGVMLAYQAFARLAGGIGNLVGATLAWEQVRELFHAAARPELTGKPGAALPPGPAALVARGARPLLECSNVAFRYAAGRPRVLDGCSFAVDMGERVLLEGASGRGKSTLVSLVSGLRQPEAGSLRVLGRDLEALGRDGWRQVVATAPQFHENYVFSGTLAFNLLMARRWPPRPEDVSEAEALCRSLGLGELLARMPGGVHQAVGETGWQLSHGERNRVFLARALLQGGAMLVLDESVDALDPATLGTVVDQVLSLDAAVILVGHVS